MSAIMSEEELQEITGPVMPLPVRHAWWQECAARPGMVLDPDIDAYVSGDRHPADDGCGIYMLFDTGDGLRYVGKAGDLQMRIQSHWLSARAGREPKFASYACLQLPEYAVRDVEVAHIYALRPSQNRLYEAPKWKQHDAMVALIRAAWRTNKRNNSEVEA